MKQLPTTGFAALGALAAAVAINRFVVGELEIGPTQRDVEKALKVGVDLNVWADTAIAEASIARRGAGIHDFDLVGRRIESIEKLACAEAVGLPGHNCSIEWTMGPRKDDRRSQVISDIGEGWLLKGAEGWQVLRGQVKHAQ